MESTIIPGQVNREQQKLLIALTDQQKQALRNGAIGLGGIIAGAGLYQLFGNNQEKVELNEKVPTADVEICEVDTEMELATQVSDQMTFNEAFSTARAEVGPGGFFNWNGRSFNTYYKEEWDKLSEDEKQSFYKRVDEQVDLSSIKEINVASDTANDNIEDFEPDEKQVEVEPNELVEEETDVSNNQQVLQSREELEDGQTMQYDIIEAEPVYGMQDFSGDGIVDAVSVDGNGDGMADVIVVDTDADGIIDGYLMNNDGDDDLDVLIIDDAQDGIDENDFIEEIDEGVSMDSFLIIDESELDLENDVEPDNLDKGLDYFEI